MHEINRLADQEGVRFGDTAVFYRTNAQSRVIEETLVRAGVPYRIIGGTKFYDRREVKDALAYLRSLVNPDDEVGWKRIVNVPEARRGRHDVRKIEAYAQGANVPFREALRDGAAAGVTGKALGGIRDLLEVMDGLEAVAEAGGVSGAARGGARAHRLPRRARGRAHDRGAGPDREPGRAGGRGARVRREPRRGRTPRRSSRSRAWTRRPSRRRGLARVQAFLEAISLVTDMDGDETTTTRSVTLMTLHTREGPRVPGRVPHRARGRDLPAHALAR